MVVRQSTHWPTWNLPQFDLQKIDNDADRKTKVLYEISGTVQEAKTNNSKANNVNLHDRRDKTFIPKLYRATAHANTFIQHLKKNEKDTG